MKNLKGWRTLLFGLILVIAPPTLNYLSIIKWDDYLSPTWATVITGAIVIVLRFITNTPIGRNNEQ